MVKCTDRFIPESMYVDECEPDSSQMAFIHDPSEVKRYADAFVKAWIIQAGAVEFKTLNDLEKNYGEEREGE